MNSVSFDAALGFFEEHDPSLFGLAKKLEAAVEPSTAKPEQFFHSLCHSIISQQLSTRVADVIQERFDTLIGGVVVPEAILAAEDQALRDIGLSWAKIKYAKDLASKVQSGEVVMEALAEMSDAEVIESLTKVKGIGQWTAEMFLIFTLGRPDVFSAGDLALRQSVAQLYGEEVTKNFDVLREFTQKWSPYRSYASLILWKTRDTQ